MQLISYQDTHCFILCTLQYLPVCPSTLLTTLFSNAHV